MDHLNSIRAALKGTAPVVAIPMEGHAPICIRAKLLKGALKGVTIDSVEVLENRWLKITGRAIGKGNSIPVRTSTSFAPMERNAALLMIWDWSEKEHKRRIKVINQGVLSASEQRAMKLAQAEKAGVAELIQAQKEEAEIFADARSNVNPVLTPVDAEMRGDIIEEYKAFRAQCGNRKRGAVIRWKLAKLREDKAKLVKQEGPRHHKVNVLRKKKDAVKYAALIYQIGQLEKQYESLYPPKWHEWYDESRGYWVDSWITKRPKAQVHRVAGDWRQDWDDEEDGESAPAQSQLKRMVVHLKNVRADIRALAPPADEQEELTQAA